MGFRRHWRQYTTSGGRAPLRDFLLSQTNEDKAKILAAMRDVAMVGLRAARHLRGEIWEVRIDGRSHAFRILFTPEGRFGQVLLALVAFGKTTKRTPPAALVLAERRLRDWRQRGEKP